MRLRNSLNWPPVASGVWLFLLLLNASCGGRSGKFGTLPQVEVPIEEQPAQDPTLFVEEEEKQEQVVLTDPPDPTPLRTRDHYDFLLGFNKGELSVLSVESVSLKNPQSAPRRMGRFAFELWTGQQLVERIRFDFPLLAASQPGAEDPIGKGLSTQTSIRVPASSRARRARILDRKTRDEMEISWPPKPSTSP